MIANYKRDLNHSFLLLEEKPMTSEEYFQMKMVTENRIEGLLPVTVHTFNGEKTLYYEISGKQNLLCIYEKKEMLVKDLERILKGIHRSLKEMEKYMLNADSLILEPEFVYLCAEDENIQLCLYPCEKRNIRESIREFSEFILNRINHQEEKVVQLAYQFYRLTRDENFNYEQIMEELFESRISSDFDQNKSLVVAEKNMEWEPVSVNIGTVADKKSSGKEKDWSRENDKNNDREKDKEKNKDKDKEESLIPKTLFLFLCILSLSYLAYYLFQKKALDQELEMTQPVMAAIGFAVLGLTGWLSCLFLDMLRQKNREKIIISESKVASERKREFDKYASKVQEMPVIDDKKDGTYGKQKEYRACEETVLLNENIYHEEGILSSRTRGKRIEIAPVSFPFMIGKLEGKVDFVLDDPSISRIHARISKEGNRLYLMDLNSKNGTSKNGIPLSVNEAVLLEAEDEIKFGKLCFTYH